MVKRQTSFEEVGQQNETSSSAGRSKQVPGENATGTRKTEWECWSSRTDVIELNENSIYTHSLRLIKNERQLGGQVTHKWVKRSVEENAFCGQSQLAFKNVQPLKKYKLYRE